MKLHHLIIAVSALAGTTMHAEGLLGQNYILGSYELTHVDAKFAKVDIGGLTLEGNLNVFANAEHGIDLRYGGAYSWDQEPKMDMKQYQFYIGGAWFYKGTEKVRPFFGIDLGYSHFDDLDAESSFFGSARVGLELEPLQNFTLTPSISVTQAVDIDDSLEVKYSLESAYWITDSINLGLAYTYTHADFNVSADSYRILARYRY